MDQRVACRRVGLHGDQVQPGDDLAAATHRARDLDALHAPPLEPGQRAPHPLDLGARVMEQPRPGDLPQ